MLAVRNMMRFGHKVSLSSLNKQPDDFLVWTKNILKFSTIYETFVHAHKWNNFHWRSTEINFEQIYKQSVWENA